MVGSLIRLVDRKFRMEMECVQQAMELILDILLYRIVHRSIWISFSNCFPSDSYLFSFNHRRGFAKMTEFAAFFPKPAERIVSLYTRSQTNLIEKKYFFVNCPSYCWLEGRFSYPRHRLRWFYSTQKKKKNKQILQFYFVIYTFYCLVLHRKKKINKQAFFFIID